MGFLEDRDLSDVDSISQYYRGKTIFITGGTGFIGKVIIEKLLYSCPDLERIYLLMRTKKGVSAEDRLAKLYLLPCFDRLRAERPEIFKSKVFIISGDVSETGLGLSEEDRALLINRGNVVFHVAASVRFDDPLTYAAKLNLQGTKEMTDLMKEFRNLSSFVHVSTSYSNTNRDPIEEVMYPPHADWRDTLKICEELDEHTIRTLTPKLLGEIPNTYTFTKQLAEHVVYEQRGQLPAVIVRPSIVIASLDEPVPAWIENFNGPVGIFVACGKGIMRTVYTKSDLISDYIPVDTCVKHIIAAGWIRGTKTHFLTAPWYPQTIRALVLIRGKFSKGKKSLEPQDGVPIYNCCSGTLNQILMSDLVTMAKVVAVETPLTDPLWSVGGEVTSNPTLHYIRVLLTHLLPAIFVDMVLWLAGKKPMLVKIQRKIYIANLALKYYTTQQWTFCNKNFIALRSAIRPEDIQQFYYEIENINLTEYFKKCVLGGRRYLLNQKDDTIPKAIIQQSRLQMLDKAIQIIFYASILWWGSKNVSYYFSGIFA